jgi:hypothetical protein
VSLVVALYSLARVVGIIMIFSVVGPLAFTAVVLLILGGPSGALLQFFLSFIDPSAKPTVVSVAGWVFGVATMLASFPPSALAGIIFALAAVYAGTNALWVAWLAVAVAIIGVLVVGAFIIPDESSAVILPNVRSVGQALQQFAVLAAVAIVPTTLCWWLAKPLSRAILPA